MTVKIQVNNPHSQYQQWKSQDAYLMQIWWLQFNSNTIYRANKPNFLDFSVKMAKLTLKVKVNDLHFQYQLRVSQKSC